MKENKHPAIFLTAALGCLIVALGLFAWIYPSTYGQPDFGYSLAVMLLIVIVCFASLDGLVVGIAGAFITRRWLFALSLVAALNGVVCIGTPILFKYFYKSNHPLLETIRDIPEQQH